MIVLQSVKGYKLFYCKSNDAGRRLDRVLKKMLPDIPAGLVYSGLRKGLIRVNGKKSKQSYRIVENDVIQVKDNITFSADPATPAAGNPDLKDRIDKMTVFRTGNIVFLNKPAGLLTHGTGSLAEMLITGLSGVENSLSFTPAPLHRLDRNTSGLMAVSLTINGASRFSELMREHRIEKFYLGICLNGPAVPLRLDDMLTRSLNKTFTDSGSAPESRRAVTTAETLLTSGRFSLCLFRIETGLTHQIRAQVSAAGFPLAGDVKYGGKTSGFKDYFLHSWAMRLPAFDEVCGFSSAIAAIPSAASEKISEIFGLKAYEKSLNRLEAYLKISDD